MKSKIYLPFLLVAMICITVPAISADDSNNQMIIILKSGEELFWSEMRSGIEQASQDLGVSVLILTPDTPYDSDAMTILAFNALKESPSILGIAPSDTTMLNPVLKSAKDKKIPVFILESPLPDAPSTGYIGSDNEEIGKGAADDMASFLNEKGAVAIISLNSRDPASVVRAQSCKQQIEQDHSGMTVLLLEGDSQGDHDLVIESFLADNPDIKGIFATDNDTTLALGRVLIGLGLTGSVVVIGVDGGVTAEGFLDDGIIQELIIQDPRAIGSTAIKIVHAYIQGEDISTDTYISTTTRKTDRKPAVIDSPSSTDQIPQEEASPQTSESTSPDSMSYQEKLQAASGKYDFNSMNQQNTLSHYSNMNQLAQQQVALAYAMSGGPSGGAGCTCRGELLPRRS